MKKVPYQSTLPELVRKLEQDYIMGTTTISKYVSFNMLETLNKVDAYLNSKHTSGETDSLGREKPFFNIVTAAVNIWYRATDIDRKDIKIKATKAKDTIDSFLATVFLHDWMRKENFGMFLNEWGRVLARFGSSIVKFVENDEGLHPMVLPWNRSIVDQVDFDNNIKIEVIELTEAQLRKRKNYNKEIVDKLCDTIAVRQTIDKQRKDNKNYYVKLYEIHGELPLSYLTGDERDEEDYVQQMHVITFLAKKDKTDEFDDFTLVSGREAKEPNMITHLIPEDGRTLAIGAVEHLFEAQWMMNHTVKSIKDQLDLASKLIFQTADDTFVGQNALSAIENGDILVHRLNMPLTQLANSSHDITSLQNFGAQWKSLSNEIVGASEAMLGKNPPSGQAWKQTEALLAESHSLFELMTENKGLYIEEMLRRYVIPYIKKKMENADEISAVLDGYDLQKIDKIYIKNKAVENVNKKIIDSFLNSKGTSRLQQVAMQGQEEATIQDSLSQLGNQRFFKPDELTDKTWKEQFKDLEWEVEVDITGESSDTQEILTTLTTVLKTIATNPGILQDPNARLVFNKILEETAVLSPIQLSDMPKPSPAQPQPLPANANGGSMPGNGGGIPGNIE